MKSLLVKTKNMVLLHIQYKTENEFQYMKMPPDCCTAPGAFDRRSSAGKGHFYSREKPTQQGAEQADGCRPPTSEGRPSPLRSRCIGTSISVPLTERVHLGGQTVLSLAMVLGAGVTILIAPFVVAHFTGPARYTMLVYSWVFIGNKWLTGSG
ncbi:MAG: hypothetical protein JWN15_3807 [Firmicutes bacterium]|nr:hypothetical protein [Bacillota bacterium]